MVTDEQAQVLGHVADAGGRGIQGYGLKAIGPQGQPLCRVPDYAACSRVRRIFIGFNLGSARHSFDAFAGTLEA